MPSPFQLSGIAPGRLIALALMLAGFIGANAVMGTPAFAREIPAAIRTSPQPPADVIRTHLTDAIKLLMSDSPVEQKKGRELITKEVENVGPTNVPFVYSYAAVLSETIGPALASSNMRVRLNAAIAVARVAEKSETPRLLPAVMTILNDQHEAVVAWGLKAARYLVKPALAANDTQLLPAIVAAGAKNPAATAAAYEALRAKEPTPAMLPALVVAMQDLLTARLAKYQSGIPGEPAADMPAALYLSETAWWGAHTKPAGQNRTAQLLSDLAAFAAQRLNSAPPDVQEQLKLVVRQAGSALIASAINTGGVDLQTKLQSVKSIGPRTFNQQVQMAASLIYPEISQVFTSVKKPATLSGGEPLPAPGPATAPSTPR